MKKYFLLGILYLFCSCSEPTCVTSTLDLAGAIMIDRPDSALELLGGVDADRIRRTSTRARYALLYSQALDKNVIDVKDDSLIRVAVDYYLKRGTTEERFLAVYYLGRVYQNAGENQSALEAFMKAEEYLADLKDNYFAGLLFFSMGDLNLAQNSFERAAHYYRKSYDSYMRDGKRKHGINALIAIARVSHLQGKYPEAVTKYSEASELARKHGFLDLEANCLACLISTSIDRKNRAAANIYKHRLMMLPDEVHGEYFCLLGHFYLFDDKPDSAEYYAHKILARQPDETHRLAARELLIGAEVARGRFDRAYDVWSEYQLLKDSVHLSHMNNSVAEAELHYKDSQLAYQHYRLYVKQQVIYGTIVLSLLALAGIVGLFRRKVTKQQKQLDEYFSMIDNMPATQAVQDSRITALYNTRFVILKELAMTYYQYGNSASLSKKVRAILSKKILDDSILKDLENTLNMEYNDVVDKFRTEYPKTNEEYVELLCLRYAGFSPQEICVITNESLAAIYMRKSRLKKKITYSKLSNKKDLLQILL